MAAICWRVVQAILNSGRSFGRWMVHWLRSRARVVRLTSHAEDCKSVRSCAVRLTMTKVRDAISDVLDRMTIADMVAMGEGSNVAPMVARGRTLQNRRPVRGTRALAGSRA